MTSISLSIDNCQNMLFCSVPCSLQDVAFGIFVQHWLLPSNDAMARELATTLMTDSQVPSNPSRVLRASNSLPVLLLQKQKHVSIKNMDQDDVRRISSKHKSCILTVSVSHLLHLIYTGQTLGNYAKMLCTLLLDYSSHDLYRCREHFDRLGECYEKLIQNSVQYAGKNLEQRSIHDIEALLQYVNKRMQTMDWYESTIPLKITPPTVMTKLSKAGIQDFFNQLCCREYVSCNKIQRRLRNAVAWSLSQGIDINDSKGTKVHFTRDGDSYADASPFENACKQGNRLLVEQLLHSGVDYSDRRTGDNGEDTVYENILYTLQAYEEGGSFFADDETNEVDADCADYTDYTERLKSILHMLLHEVPDSCIDKYLDWQYEWSDKIVLKRQTTVLHMQIHTSPLSI